MRTTERNKPLLTVGLTLMSLFCLSPRPTLSINKNRNICGAEVPNESLLVDSQGDGWADECRPEPTERSLPTCQAPFAPV